VNTRFIPLLALMMVSPAAAQMQHGGNHMVAGIKPLYDGIRSNLVRSAELMPESNFSFKPVPEVRSYGQLLGHVANSAYYFCSLGSGETNPAASSNFEQTTDKAGLIKAVADAFAFCDLAYAINDARAMEKVQIFNAERDRMHALVLNIGHLNEHYGNIVTYLRIKGLVPPSSQR
jgi:uncharacterized damage-inducible protein DinB